MKLLRKKNGQWFTISVAVGGMLLGATSINAAASETDVDSQEVNVSGETLPEGHGGDNDQEAVSQTDEPVQQAEEPASSGLEQPAYIADEVSTDNQVDSFETPNLEGALSDTQGENPVESVDENNQEFVEAPLSVEGESVSHEATNSEVAENKADFQQNADQEASSQDTEPLATPHSLQEDQENENQGDLGQGQAGEVQESLEFESNPSNVTVNSSQVVDPDQDSKTGQADVPSVESPDTFRNELVNVRNTWSEGYRGEGQVVAIIDSGLYYDHRAFQSLSDLDRAYYQSEAELNQAKEAAGIDYGRWINDKVVFTYNYNDLNTELVEDDHNSHGTHVADSAVGNPALPLDIGTEDNPDAQMYVQGVAPEAQLMFMRVFSDLNNPGATGEFLYVQAIRDAVALGAQSINLSLGAPGGSQYNTTGVLEQAIAEARQQGVSVVIAAGNEDSFGSGHNNPLVKHPDYGIVGTPSTSRDSISVAAVDSLYLVNDVLNLTDAEGNVINLRLNVVANGGQETLESPDYANTEFEYEYVGFGTADDFVGVDLTGKFALISRGQNTFAEKAQNAQNAGAAGVIIFNNIDDGTLVNMGVDGLENYPIIGVNYEAGQVLIENQDTHRVSFAGETLQFVNPNAGNLTDFTSWGLSADGELKPDLAAPGGNVYGAVNNDDYSNMSGTSMAAPHVAGAVALLNQKLPDLYEGLEGQELSDLVKALLMSTARPHYNQERGAYTSPRQQGAGLIDVDNALNAGLYLTGADQYPSISLRNVGDRFEFDVYVYNISDEDRTLDVTTHLATDAVTDTLLGPAFALEPRHLKDVPEGQVFVAANSHEVVTISVDAREFTEALLTEMPNGYFLEGFVSFGSAEDPLLASIPFVGFRGDFANLDVVEQPVYEFGFDFSEDLSDAPFYFVDMSTGYTTNNYTSLVSNDGNSLITLGEDTVASFASNEDVVLAISPDQDGLKDFVGFRGVFLRNYEDFTASVSFLNDLGEEELVWESPYPTSGVKSHFSSNPFRPKSTIPITSLWLGQDMDGNTVQDGLYTYQISLRPQVPGSITQLLSFDVYVSTTTPTATGADYDAETGLLTLREVENDQPGLNPYRSRIAYGEAPDPLLLQFGLVEDTREYFYLNGRDDYSFYLPDYVDLYSPHTILYLEDYAGNSSEVLLSDILHGDSGVVEFALIEATTGEDLTGAGLRVRIRDAQGNVVAGERLVGQNDQNVRRLPFGTYTAELFLINEEYFEPVGSRVQTFVVSEDNSWQTVAFYVNYIERVNFRVELNQELPQGGAIYLVDNDGNATLLPATSYVNTVHQLRVPVGEYTIVVDLPEGYTSEQDGMTVTVDSANRSVAVEIERIVADKSELEVLLQQAEAVDRSQLSSGQSLVLDIVLNYAYTVYNAPEALQSQVDDAADALRAQLEVIDALDALVQDRQAAKGRLAEFTLLSPEELANYSAQVDAAQSQQEISQVVAEAKVLQLERQETLARLELLETAQAEAVAQINRLEYLSEPERSDFVDQVYSAESIEAVNQVLDQALEADAQARALADLEEAKDRAVETINNLTNLPEDDCLRLIEKVEVASTVEEVEGLVEEAVRIANHPSNSRGNNGRGNNGNNGRGNRGNNGNNGRGNNGNNGRGNDGNNGRGNNGRGNQNDH